MKFRYIGEYPDDRNACEAYGCVFHPGDEIEVPAQFQSKALGNRFFEACVEDAEIVEDDENTEETADASVEDDPEVALPEKEADANDPDSEYNPYEGMSKSDLVAMAEERGIAVDGRWSPGKIIAKIESAKDVENGDV